MDKSITFGKALRDARRSRGMSQEDLAKELGLSRQTIMYYEADDRKPKKRETEEKISNFMNIDVCELRALYNNDTNCRMSQRNLNEYLRMSRVCDSLHIENAELLKRIEELEGILNKIRELL